mgnify:CR=1 FL=1
MFEFEPDEYIFTKFAFFFKKRKKKKEEEEKKGELTAKIIERTKRKTKSFDNAAKASSENE